MDAVQIRAAAPVVSRVLVSARLPTDSMPVGLFIVKTESPARSKRQDGHEAWHQADSEKDARNEVGNTQTPRAASKAPHPIPEVGAAHRRV